MKESSRELQVFELKLEIGNKNSSGRLCLCFELSRDDLRGRVSVPSQVSLRLQSRVEARKRESGLERELEFSENFSSRIGFSISEQEKLK